VTTQEQAFRAYYATMSDTDLLRIAANRVSFIGTAQRVLAAELEKRHLEPSPPASPPARHSVFWNWGTQMARFARRLHHHPASP
jgi:hypothetical protein